MAPERGEYIVVDRVLQQVHCLIELHIVDFATLNEGVLFFIYSQRWGEDRVFDIFPEAEAFDLSGNASLLCYEV